MVKKKKKNFNVADQLTQSVGTSKSLIVHTIFFIGIFSLLLLGVSLDDILLILTTAVSL